MQNEGVSLWMGKLEENFKKISNINFENRNSKDQLENQLNLKRINAHTKKTPNQCPSMKLAATSVAAPHVVQRGRGVFKRDLK